MNHPKPNKREVFELLWEAGEVWVKLDPRRAGVNLPAHLLEQSTVALQLSPNFVRPPITDLVADDAGFACTIPFGGRPAYISIPWSSVRILHGADLKGIAWDLEDEPVTRDARTGYLGAKLTSAVGARAQHEIDNFRAVAAARAAEPAPDNVVSMQEFKARRAAKARK